MQQDVQNICTVAAFLVAAVEHSSQLHFSFQTLTSGEGSAAKEGFSFICGLQWRFLATNIVGCYLDKGFGSSAKLGLVVFW